MATASYSVRVAWEAVPANAFVLDGSQLDSSKQLTSTFSGLLDVLQFGLSTFGGTDLFADNFSALYTDVSSSVMSVNVRRGRSDNLDAFSAGEATVLLNDPTGTYNPLNSSSPLSPYVLPGRPVEIEASFNGTRYGMFRGFVRSIEHDPNSTAKTTRLLCQDLFLYLDRAKPVITALAAPTTTGTVIGKILDAVGWTEVAYRSIATGDTINYPGGWATNGSTSALSLITTLLETERGEFFHGRDGVVMYRDRFSRYKATSVATLIDVSAGSAPATDLTNIKNRATVTKTGYGSQSWNDGGSISNYGPSDYAPIESAYINDTAQALSLAQWLVSQTSNPTPPVRALEYSVNVSDALMTNALAREIGDKITVADAGSGVSSREFFIEGIEHTIERGGTRHQVRFALSRVSDSSPIVFGISRAVNGEFSSPTVGTSPYTTASTSPDVFAF